jgi:pyochelin biosynthesis protein PchC
VRLVCFPHAGGSAVFYRNWARAFPSSVELVAVQYPGRMERFTEAPIDDVHEMADAIARAILRAVRPPLALFGHSMGAMVAFETALRLECGPGPSPIELFVSGRKGPSRHRRGVRHTAPDEALFAYLRTLGGTDAAVFEQAELRPVLLPLLRSDFKCSETWQPDRDARVGCDLKVLVGDSDPEVSLDEAACWGEATDGAFVMRVFRGNHFYLIEHEQAVIADLHASCEVQLQRLSPPGGALRSGAL